MECDQTKGFVVYLFDLSIGLGRRWQEDFGDLLYRHPNTNLFQTYLVLSIFGNIFGLFLEIFLVYFWKYILSIFGNIFYLFLETYLFYFGTILVLIVFAILGFILFWVKTQTDVVCL